MPDPEIEEMKKEAKELMGSLKEGVNQFTSHVTAQTEKEKTKRVNNIAQLAVKANKDKEYTVESLSVMSDESLGIVENSLNDLIKALETNNQTPPDQGAGGFVDRGAQIANSSSDLSRGEVIDKLVDMISHAYGLPILTPEEKYEVSIEHAAQGLNYL
jgi:hypothetical protein